MSIFDLSSYIGRFLQKVIIAKYMGTRMVKTSLALSVGLLWAGTLLSQGLITPNDYIRDYWRLLEIQGKPVESPILYQTNQLEVWGADAIEEDSSFFWEEQFRYYRDTEEEGLNLYILSPRVDYVYNSEYSRSYNDGPLWSGKGSTVGLNAGFKVKWGRITGIVYPNFYHSQNQFFQLQSGRESQDQSPFNYQLSDYIDWVQLFGLDPLNEWDFGQSSLSIALGDFQVKLGTENIWWGPSVLNPLIFSNTGPGFPHLDIGTRKPLKTKYGDFELNSLWGQLYESDFLPNITTDSRRYITAFTLGYRPSFNEFTKGLSIGIGRVVYQNWPDSGLSFGDVFQAFSKAERTSTTDSDRISFAGETNQYFSFNARWVLSEAGAELYTEWVRDEVKDFLEEADRGSAITFGIQKAFSYSKSTWRIGFEHSSLAASRAQAIENSGDIYTHSQMRQGFTHRGFLLGAPVGPGSRSQLIRIDRFDKKGKYGFTLNRIRFNDNFFFRRFNDFTRHDVEWNFGLETVRFFKNFEFSGNLIYSRRMNWHFFHNLDVNNFQFITSIRYHISGKPILSLFGK